MNLYKHHTDRELIAVLKNSALLTYEAKLNIAREVKKRNIHTATIGLDNQIDEEEQAIHNFEYLKDLGFIVSHDSQSGAITIRRAARAKFTDAISIFIGVILLALGLVHFWLLVALFVGDNEFTLFKLFSYTLFIGAGLIGFNMLGGLHRFLDFYDFSLAQLGNEIKLQIGGEREEQLYTLDDLHLSETEDGQLVFQVGDIDLIHASKDNLVYKHTLEALLDKMNNNL